MSCQKHSQLQVSFSPYAPSYNQIKLSALEAQIGPWLALVPTDHCLRRPQRTRRCSWAVMNARTDTGGRYFSRGESCGNCRAMETVEKSCKGRGSSLSDFSTSSHSAWKTLRKKQKRGEFSTVPTASAAGYFPRKEPVSRRRYPGLCFAETYLPRKAPASGEGAGCQGKQSCSQLRSSLFLTVPFIGHSLCS